MNLLIVGAAANVTDHLFVEALHLKARDLLNPGLELRSALWIIKAPNSFAASSSRAFTI